VFTGVWLKAKKQKSVPLYGILLRKNSGARFTNIVVRHVVTHVIKLS